MSCSEVPSGNRLHTGVVKLLAGKQTTTPLPVKKAADRPTPTRRTNLMQGSKGRSAPPSTTCSTCEGSPSDDAPRGDSGGEHGAP